MRELRLVVKFASKRCRFQPRFLSKVFSLNYSIMSTGHYLFIETSVVPTNSKAWFESPSISSQAGKCFQFWYHMYGSSIGELNIYLLTSNTIPSIPVWSRQKDQGNSWYVAQISMPQASYVKVSSCSLSS